MVLYVQNFWIRKCNNFETIQVDVYICTTSHNYVQVVLDHFFNYTSKILLLVELNNRMPKVLQDDFHRLCSLQFPNYDSYLKMSGEF